MVRTGVFRRHPSHIIKPRANCLSKAKEGCAAAHIG